MAVTHRHAWSVSPPPSSPPDAQPQPLTKRDVRRNRIMERLQTMIDSFTSHQHQHYRAQLQAVQVDMTLVLRADPHAATPLDDGADEITQLVESTINGSTVAHDEAAKKDFDALAGSRYREFAREMNDGMEQRDADLTALHNQYTSAIAALERETQQKLHQATEEHAALAQTIRQRLIASITKKRAHLLRDKESLDIADSNALLLHPNHFSINNPGSPGGNGGQNRKTRHLRHRAVSPGAADGENGVKRKRKAAAMEGDDAGNESSAPGFRSLPPPDALGGGRSPFKDARERNVYTQYEAPAYSLERLFTEKELAMATETARHATYKHFHRSQPEQDAQASGGNATTVPSVDGRDPMDTAGDGDDGNVQPTTEAATGAIGTPPLNHAVPATAAPEMERTTSHQVLTRGGARANPLAALSDLATAAAASAAAPVRDNPFAPVVPSYHAVTRSEKSGAPAPPSVSNLDVDNDFEMMRQTRDPEDSPQHPPPSVSRTDLDNLDDQAARAKEMRNQLLDQALGLRTITQPYRLPLLETGPALIGKGVERLLASGFAPSQPIPLDVTHKSRLAGLGVGGGGGGGSMAAALQGRMAGGELMSRTSSAGGASEMGEAAGAPRRGRGRLV